MTSTEIRECLTEIGHAAEIPAHDRISFQARVRAERRRRTAGRALVAGAAAVAVVGAALTLAPHGGAGATTVPDRTVPASAAEPDPGRGDDRVPLALEHRFQELLPDGSSYATDQQVEEVLGTSADGVVVIDGDSRVLLLPLRASGQPGVARPLAGGEPVQGAWLDKTGAHLGFIDLDNRLHLRPIGSDRDTETHRLLASQTRLMATDGTRWVEDEGDRLSLRLPDQSFDIDANPDPQAAELGGDTLAVHTAAGIEFYDADDGTRRFGNLGGSTGSLSPDGTTYAASPNVAERDNGMHPDVFVVDTTTGDQTRFTGLDEGTAALALTWPDDDHFLVLATTPSRRGNHVLWECTVATRSCAQRYDDPSGTLQIASQ